MINIRIASIFEDFFRKIFNKFYKHIPHSLCNVPRPFSRHIERKSCIPIWPFSFLQQPSALRTISKVRFCRRKTAMDTKFIGILILSAVIAPLHQIQISRRDLHLSPAADPVSNLRIKLIQRVTAAALYVITSLPFEDRYKKQPQIHVRHQDLIPTILTAFIADNKLLMSNVLFPLIDTHYKKHLPIPFF